MRIRLLAVGKLRDRATIEACAEFAKRLAPYHAFETIEVRAAHGGRPQDAVRSEAAALLRQVRSGEPLWLLERTGTQLSSDELAARLSALRHTGIPSLCIAVAGTYGADPSLRERADFVWSLSKLTLLHEWARAIVLEQLYRAAKIASNEPYHH